MDESSDDGYWSRQALHVERYDSDGIPSDTSDDVYLLAVKETYTNTWGGEESVECTPLGGAEAGADKAREAGGKVAGG